MKLVVKRQQFDKVISTMLAVIPAQTVDSNLKNILLSIDDNSFKILASNDSLSILYVENKSKADSMIISLDPGSIQIPANILSGAIKKMSGEVITLELADDSLLLLTDERSEYRITVVDSKEYPNIDLEYSPLVCVKLNMDDYRKLYSSTYFATAKTGSKEMFYGINIFCKNKRLTFVATDSYRLARKYIDIDQDQLFTITVPLQALSLVNSLEDYYDIEMFIEPTKVIFKLGSFTIYSKLYNSDFPNVDRMIPQNINYTLEVDSKELLNAISIVNVIGKKKIQFVCAEEGGVEIINKDFNYGNSKTPLTSAKYIGNGSFSLICNSDFVSDAIKALDTERISIEFVSDSRAFLVKSKDDSNTQIVTPIRSFTD